MKQFCPLALAILVAGCAITPQDREASHQRQLEKEARANFIALKSQEHPGQAVVLHDEAAATAPRPRASLQPTSHFVPTAYVPPASAARVSRQDDTVYYWQVQTAHRRTTPRQQAAEARYARELAKHIEDLTPEERTWADEHY